MNKEEKVNKKSEKKQGFSEQEFIDFLEERFRKLRLDEQKFRDEVLTKQSLDSKNPDYLKIED